jgi:Flp pilus assembly protein TadB
MSDRIDEKDPAAIWKNQPSEEIAMNPEQMMNRRTQALYASTRSEILMSIGAALLLVAVMVLRFGLVYGLVEEVGSALVVIWVAVTLFRLRKRIWRQEANPDAAAATGVDYYRRELERRRDHLRDAWLWHGPLLLACLILAGIWYGWGGVVYLPLGRVLPLVAALVIWVGFGLWRRLRQAKQLQREIDQLGRVDRE